MTELTPLSKALLRAAILKHLGNVVKAAEKENKTVLDGMMRKGDTLAVWSPIDDDAKIARVSKSNPDAKALTTDREAVARWVEEHYPKKMRDEAVIVGTDAEIVAVLKEHAPHLLAIGKTVPAWVFNELEVMAASAGRPVGFSGEIDKHAPPGIEIVKPDGVLSVTLDKLGPSALQELWEAHMFAMDGTVRELPAADDSAPTPTSHAA
jgi:hypothetical protein